MNHKLPEDILPSPSFTGYCTEPPHWLTRVLHRLEAAGHVRPRRSRRRAGAGPCFRPDTPKTPGCPKEGPLCLCPTPHFLGRIFCQGGAKREIKSVPSQFWGPLHFPGSPYPLEVGRVVAPQKLQGAQAGLAESICRELEEIEQLAIPWPKLFQLSSFGLAEPLGTSSQEES